MKRFPRQATIEHFGSGGFRFAGLSHHGSLLITPGGMQAWAPTTLSDVSLESLAPLAAERESFDFFLIGTGAQMQRLPLPFRDQLETLELRADVMGTSAAVHTYNLMLAEGRRVAAALLAVLDAHARPN